MSILRQHLKLLVLTGAVVAGATGNASADRLKFPFSGKCVDIAYASKKDGGRATQFECRNQSNQSWLMRRTENPKEYEIVNKHSGKCLEISEGSTADKAWAQQWTCNHGNHQRFRLADHGSLGGYTVYTFTAVHSSKCLDVSGGTIQDGAQIIQFACTGGTNQDILWTPQ